MEQNETKAAAVVEHAPVAEAKSEYTLRETAEALGRSDIWIRRQFSKSIGALGAAAFKNDDNNWRIGVAAVEAEKTRLAAKDALRVARAKGEVPKQAQVYTPDRVKAPAIVKTMLKEAKGVALAEKYAVGPKEIAQFASILNELAKVELAAWETRQAQRAAEEAEA